MNLNPEAPMRDTERPVPQILDCTLRDGSYAINFAFTAEDTRICCAGLDAVGIRWIEVGHGVGMGASEAGYGRAAATDEEYMVAAGEGCADAAWGMFCIPKIASIDHLSLGADHGMGFVRIGSNIEDRKSIVPFLRKAESLGIFSCVNFMKSYTSPPEEFAQCAREAADSGAGMVYLVDSAGGMLPDQIRRYAEAVRAAAPNLRLGFHGHHNLGLGVANSLVAVEHGVEFIDTSLQGLGRSAGNTPTELFVCAMMRLGVDLDIDPIRLLDLGEEFVRPRHAPRGIDPFDVVSGLAQFHSSYMHVIEKAARRHDVDPRHLIVAVCERDRINAPEAMVEEEALALAARGATGGWKALYKRYYGEEQR